MHDDLYTLWKTYRTGPDLLTRHAARQKLFEAGAIIIRRTTYSQRRRLPPRLDWEDAAAEIVARRLVQYLDSYNPKLGTTVEAYIVGKTYYDIRGFHRSARPWTLATDIERPGHPEMGGVVERPTDSKDSPQREVARREIWDILASVLKPRELWVLRGIYQNNEDMCALAMQIDCGHTRVSQIHKSALSKLRRRPALFSAINDLLH